MDNRHNSNSNSCNAIIVPQGKEHIDLYSTQKGLQSLIEQLKTNRIIVIKPITGNMYNSLQQVKQEMNTILPQFIQQGCPIQKVPYLTDGNTLGDRQYLYKGDTLYVEEVIRDGQGFRRLVLTENISQIQSQFKLTYLSAKNVDKLKVQSGILPSKKGMVVGIDKTYLDERYAQAIVCGILNLMDRKKLKKGCRMLMIGAGGCMIAKFMNEHYEAIQITAVDSNAEVIQVASKYFELSQQQQYLRFVHSDAYELVQSLKGEQYDIIVVDINAKQDQPWPPRKYTEQHFLNKLYECLYPEGVLAVNFLKQDITENQGIFLGIKGLYPLYRYSRGDQSQCHIIFGVKKYLQIKQVQGQLMIQLEESTVQLKSQKNNIDVFSWQADILCNIKLIKPLGVQVQVLENQQKKKKKKKK